MQLKDLGFDSWFEDQFSRQEDHSYSTARVTAVDRDRYVIRNESGEIRAELTGKLRFSAESALDLPCVGDWVWVQYYD
ncbi:MAG: ribosome small subunit-dependent GTPase A, partial [Rhodothermales bacterium]|nr:ribosome small subunit-dependent GTPase A [Rhodothermales bacterium]